jgi:hypothetical protein
MMRLRVSRMQTAINAGVAMALGLALGSCGNTPTGPTPTGQVSIQSPINVQGATGVAGAVLAPTSVSGSDFTAGTSVTFGTLVGASTYGAGAIVAADLAAPVNLQRLVQGTRVNLGWGAPPGPDRPASYVIESRISISIERSRGVRHG